MKTSAAPLAILALCALAPSCSHNKSPEAELDEHISEFEVSQTICNANRIYCMVNGGDTAYIDISASLHWPDHLGDADIKVLHDSLLRFTFGDTVSTKLHEAVRRYLTDTSIFTDGLDQAAITLTPVDSMPWGDVQGYLSNVTATVNELSEDLVTYNISSELFLGGAHPVTASHPFTFDLRNSTVLNPKNMFTVPADSILPIVKTALARQLEVNVSNLDRAGIFTDQLTNLGYPYIAGDVIYFHYNPYDIASYAMGAIDVAVYPYEIEQYLTPQARSLFRYNF